MIFAALLGCLMASSVKAQPVPGPVIREVRELVEDYELKSGLEAVARLSAELNTGRLRAADLLEARFLRAMTAADLLLLSGYSEWDRIDAQLARAFGVKRDELIPAIDRALEEVREGRFIPLVDDARAALAARFRGGISSNRLGSRTDLVYLSSVNATLSALPKAEALAPLGADPCGEGSCDEGLLKYSAASRRAYAALERALSSITRLIHASDFGDPFARAAEDGLHQLSRQLLGAAIEMSPSLPESVGRIEGEGEFDTLVSIQEDGVVVQSKARVRLDPRGLALPDEGACGSRRFIKRGGRMLNELVEVLRQSRASCGERVVISASDTLEVDDFFAAIRSVRRAGSTLLGVAGRRHDGEVGVREFAVVQGRQKRDVPILKIEPESITYLVAAKRRVLSFPRESGEDEAPREVALSEEEQLERLKSELALDEAEAPLIIRANQKVSFEQLRLALRLERARISLWVH